MKTNADAAQILLHWAAQKGIATIPKTNKLRRLIRNRACNPFEATSAKQGMIRTI
jgi:diketogulonate reductase-like aldo/keto reductase